MIPVIEKNTRKTMESSDDLLDSKHVRREHVQLDCVNGMTRTSG